VITCPDVCPLLFILISLRSYVLPRLLLQGVRELLKFVATVFNLVYISLPTTLNMYSSDDELPQPPGSRSPSPPLPLNTAAFRKRSYGEASEASSDMPFFSSDDLADASIGNYTSPRHKKQYRRTWWESESSSAATRKDGIRRAAKRAKDSGVFMPSSDSSGPEEGFGYNQLKPITPPKRETSTISPKRVAQSGAPNFFRELVKECLDDNIETIDAQ